MQPPRKKPCKECPFKRGSLPGYTGAKPADDFVNIAIVGESPLPCHLTVNYEDPKWATTLDADGTKVHHCAGYAIFIANNCKSPRNPDVPIGKADYKTVFIASEMMQHHSPQTKQFGIAGLLAKHKS